MQGNEKKWDKKMLKRQTKLSTKVFSFIQIQNRSRKCLFLLLYFFTSLRPFTRAILEVHSFSVALGAKLAREH